MRARALLPLILMCAAVPAHGATTIDFSTTPDVGRTIFADLPQETDIAFRGCSAIRSCASTLSLAPDVSRTVWTHGVDMPRVGANVGDYFSAPSARFDFSTIYRIGDLSATLVQTIAVRQILHGQFSMSVTAGSPVTIDLGRDGVLHIAGVATSSQYRANEAGWSSLRSTFTLRAPAAAPVPEPATWALLLLGFFGIAGMMRKHVRSPAMRQSVAV